MSSQTSIDNIGDAAPSQYPPPVHCLVCRAGELHEFAHIDHSIYWRCPECKATILDPRSRLGRDAEYAHYSQHENDPEDEGYRAFLSRLSTPLMERLPPGSDILDYGCGPGPALAAMLREAGHGVTLFDQYFHPDAYALQESYDAITCTEVAEHFHNPAAEFDRLAALLRPGGILAVMTCFQTDDARFARWHYRLDPTHVVFYRVETLRTVALQRGLSFESPAKDIAMMQKRTA